MKKYVIFDFDGTLADAKQVVFDTVNTLVDQFGFPRLQEDQMDQMKNVSTEQYQLIAKDFYALYKQSLHKIWVNSGYATDKDVEFVKPTFYAQLPNDIVKYALLTNPTSKA